MTRFARTLAPLLLALMFGLTPSPSMAQPPEEPVAEEGEGNPVPGYLATAMIGVFILFVVGRAPRR